MRHTDANNNVWYDGVTLTSCSYVHVADGCTGTVSNCSYIEIGEGNTNLNLSNVSYCTIGNANSNVKVNDSDYIIIGSECEKIRIGSHDPSNTRFTGRTGGRSIVVGHKTTGAEITGFNSKYDKSRNIQADGTFNKVVKSGAVFLDEAHGNELRNSSRVDLKETNNNTVELSNINLTQKAAFNDYAFVKNVVRVKSNIPVVNRQSDAQGIILDRSLNALINAPKGQNPKDDTPTPDQYTLNNGVWVLVNK